MSWDENSINIIFRGYNLQIPHTITIIFLIYVLVVVLTFCFY